MNTFIRNQIPKRKMGSQGLELSKDSEQWE